VTTLKEKIMDWPWSIIDIDREIQYSRQKSFWCAKIEASNWFIHRILHIL